MNQWRLKVTKCDTKLLAKQCNISDIAGKILANRKIQSEEEAKKFINASLDDLYSPFLMKDMQQGVDIVLDAIDEGKKIVVYGDYDAGATRS